MRFLVFVLLRICKLSWTFPRLLIGLFLVLGVAGFAALPFITLSTTLMAGVGAANPVIRLTAENSAMFGEQDSLIIVLEFPEPPGEGRLPFMKGLAETVAELPGVRRVRYRFLDPDDKEHTIALLQQFLLGMNEREREEIQGIFSAQGVKDALRRNINRLFLAENPYIRKHLLDDPLELGRFAAASIKKRVGSVSLGDVYLLIASPDSTLYLIQITPGFPSDDVVRGRALVDKLREEIPAKITSLMATIPGVENQFKGLNWYLTGRVVFHQESGEIFDRETLTIVLCSFGLVLALLLSVYRSFWSTVLLMAPLAAGIGPNYGVMYVFCGEVNPVVMGATGVLLGLGTEYGEHLWGRIREELDKGTSPMVAVAKAYEGTGPPVLLGALTGVLAFLCLCLSDQSALIQFGYLGASGLILTLISTLFLVPALARVASTREKDYFPRIKVSFKAISTLFQKRPGTIVVLATVIILTSLVFASRVSYEQDLFKVFLARNMHSMAMSQKISRKFHSDFSRPTYLSFDVDDLQQGLLIQRELDGILEGMVEKDREIASFDSISYLMSPDVVQRKNIEVLSHVAESWPQLNDVFKRELKSSRLSSRAAQTMEEAFESAGKILRSLRDIPERHTQGDLAALERSWYMSSVKGKYRFLTRIRLSNRITDPAELKSADAKIIDAVKQLPIEVRISGTRQAMEAVLSNLVSELLRLGTYAFLTVVFIFYIVFPHPRGVALCLIPMVGAFCITLGVLGAVGMGLPFSIVCVAPLIFGFGIHNGIHVVMGSLYEEGGSIARATTRVTPRAMVTSLTIIMGFVSMLTSQHYSLQFLGSALVIGLVAAVPLTLTVLPALLLVLERRRKRRESIAAENRV